MKTLCSALLDCLVLPLQDKMEDWKKVIENPPATVSNVNKELQVCKKVLSGITSGSKPVSCLVSLATVARVGEGDRTFKRNQRRIQM